MRRLFKFGILIPVLVGGTLSTASTPANLTITTTPIALPTPSSYCRVKQWADQEFHPSISFTVAYEAPRDIVGIRLNFVGPAPSWSATSGALPSGFFPSWASDKSQCVLTLTEGRWLTPTSQIATSSSGMASTMVNIGPPSVGDYGWYATLKVDRSSLSITFNQCHYSTRRNNFARDLTQEIPPFTISLLVGGAPYDSTVVTLDPFGHTLPKIRGPDWSPIHSAVSVPRRIDGSLVKSGWPIRHLGSSTVFSLVTISASAVRPPVTPLRI